ncbi:hypothetical protein B7L70_03190 [Vulcanisaeta sp. EB80]|nr:hypothetical protein B7L70_03190 [Vulcanisaeta sp. EB80]
MPWGMDYLTIGLLVAVLGLVVSTLGIVISLTRSVGELRGRLTGVERDVEALRSEVRSGFSRLANTITSANEITIEYLGLRGVLNQGDVGFLRTVIKGLASTATTNPLTETERKRLLELVDKDDLTIEEAEELYRLARKLYEEYIDKTPDAFKALLYAAAMRGITYRKYGRKPPNLDPNQPTNTQS